MSQATTRPADHDDREARRQDGALGQFVGFRIDDQDYGIAITKAREIITMRPITRLPRASAAIEGLINLRGNVIPVVNLRARFGLPARPHDDETRTIVTSIDDRTVGFIVDEVTQVIKVAADQIQPMPVAMDSAAGRTIQGLVRMDDRLLILLDCDRLFDPGELEHGQDRPAPGPDAPRPIGHD